MPDRSTPQFGSLLRRHRLAAGLSQAELAERAGLSTNAVAALESGRRATPRPYTVRVLADALSLAEDDRLRLMAAAQTAPPSFAEPLAEGAWTANGDWGRVQPPPRPPTRLIGREREVAEIAFALRSGPARLVTLTGPGGVGKTRLAIAAADAIAGAFPDGVVWVELAHIIAPAEEAAPLVAGAIARALGSKEPARPALAASLATAIGSRQVALMLDNFEHLLSAAPLVAEVLAACPQLVLLVTSRERLHVRGEREFAVQPLAVPDRELTSDANATGMSGVAAVRLFAERAVEVRGDFALTAANTPAVARLCRQLDGLPLAIELAARWVKVLSPEALAERLVPSLPLLAGGAGDLPDRQQTMRNTVAWSYELLHPEEQRLFQRLGVFAGGFTLEAARWVADGEAGDGRREAGDDGGNERSPDYPNTLSPSSDTLALVAALVDKSLVRSMASAASGTSPRFEMLETIREFALERLVESGEEPATREAHARYCTHLVERLSSPAIFQMGPLDQLQAEHANVRAALEWLDTEGSDADFVHLAAMLPGFWYMGSHVREGRAWLEQALLKAEVASPHDRPRVQVGLAWLLTLQGELDAAESLFTVGIQLLRAAGADLALGTALNWQSSWAVDLGDLTQAETILTEALAVVETVGGQLRAVASKASALGNLGIVACLRGDFELAETRLAEALRLRDAHGLDLAAALSVGNLADVAYARGDFHLAIERYREGLARFGERGELYHVASALAGVACSAAALGHARDAARLFGAAQAVLERAGIPAFEPAWQARVDRHRDAVQRVLGDEAFGRAWAEGHNHSWSELMDEVAALSEPAPAPPTLPAPAPRPGPRARAVRRRGSGCKRRIDHGD